MTPEPTERPTYDAEAFRKARSGRNIALGLGLVAFVAIVFVVTVIQMAGNADPHF
jgi:t-SNARE complex subunit (syntaxin)